MGGSSSLCTELQTFPLSLPQTVWGKGLFAGLALCSCWAVLSLLILPLQGGCENVVTFAILAKLGQESAP